MKKAPEGVWYIEEDVQQAQYINIVHNAALSGPVKDFLKTIAGVATWRKAGQASGSYVPCFANQKTLQSYMGRKKDYVTKSKKKAEKLGWIKVVHNPPFSDWIWPKIGIDDPEVLKKRESERDSEIDSLDLTDALIRPEMQDLPNNT